MSTSRSKGRGRTRGRGRLLGAWVAQDPGTLTWAESRCLTLLSHPGAPCFFSLNLYCDFSLTPFFWNPKLHMGCDLLASEILFVFINHMKGKQQKQLEYSHCNPAVKDKLSLPAMFLLLLLFLILSTKNVQNHPWIFTDTLAVTFHFFKSRDVNLLITIIKVLGLL